MKISVKADINEVNKQLRQYVKQTDSKFYDEISAAGLQTESTAKRLAPIDKGILRSSIKTDNSRKGVSIVGTDVKYSEFVEFGTRYMRAQPYLRPAFDKEVKELIKKLKIAYNK